MVVSCYITVLVWIEIHIDIFRLQQYHRTFIPVSAHEVMRVDYSMSKVEVSPTGTIFLWVNGGVILLYFCVTVFV